MKILFVLNNTGAFKNYDSTIKKLSQRGHKIKLIFNKFNIIYPKEVFEKEFFKNKNVSYEIIPNIGRLFWKDLDERLRTSQDFFRYYSKEYENIHKLKERARTWASFYVRIFGDIYLKNNPERIFPTIKALRKIGECIPLDKKTFRVIEKFNPDVILVSPLVSCIYNQDEWVRLANKKGIPICWSIASWDNLTTKGIIKSNPDRVIVWNKFQKEEAIKMHHIDENKIVITGSQVFDKWFNMKPSKSREKFLQEIGLDHKKPYILYACSAELTVPNEIEIVKDLVEKIRNSKDKKIKNLGILIRPHPGNVEKWKNIKFQKENVVIYPLKREMPINKETNQNYFNSIYNSAAVIGINTTTMIEAGIFDKPVLTILLKNQSHIVQGETIHFHYLINEGLATLCKNYDEVFTNIKKYFKNKSYKKRDKEFTKKFVRPNGLNKNATDILVREIENLKNIKKKQTKEKTILGLVFLFPIAFSFFIIYRLTQTLNQKHKSLKKYYTPEIHDNSYRIH